MTGPDRGGACDTTCLDYYFTPPCTTCAKASYLDKTAYNATGTRSLDGFTGRFVGKPDMQVTMSSIRILFSCRFMHLLWPSKRKPCI